MCIEDLFKVPTCTVSVGAQTHNRLVTGGALTNRATFVTDYHRITMVSPRLDLLGVDQAPE